MQCARPLTTDKVLSLKLSPSTPTIIAHPIPLDLNTLR